VRPLGGLLTGVRVLDGGAAAVAPARAAAAGTTGAGRSVVTTPVAFVVALVAAVLAFAAVLGVLGHLLGLRAGFVRLGPQLVACVGFGLIGDPVQVVDPAGEVAVLARVGDRLPGTGPRAGQPGRRVGALLRRELRVLRPGPQLTDLLPGRLLRPVQLGLPAFPHPLLSQAFGLPDVGALAGALHHHLVEVGALEARRRHAGLDPLLGETPAEARALRVT
jgi:hypothetical protein